MKINFSKSLLRQILLIAGLFCSLFVYGQASIKQSINTTWGSYIGTNVSGHGNTLLQVSIEGQNSFWNGVFLLNGVNSYTPNVTWNNARLISFSGYNTGTDDVQALIMSGLPTNQYGGTEIVLKTGMPASGTATITVVATGGPYAQNLSLTSFATSPYTYTMASSAGTFTMWTVNSNTGVGTIAPEAKLHVEGNGLINGDVRIGNTQNEMGYGKRLEFGYQGNSDAIWMVRNNLYPDQSELRLNIGDDGNDRFTIGHTFYSNGAWMPAVSITSSGHMSVGTMSVPSGYCLAVGGNIIAEKVRVQLQPQWPDYVFEKGYRLPTLREVEQFVQKNKHLPDVPSAQEVIEKGLDLGENQAVLLKKIEELTLYIIQQQKTIDQFALQLNEVAELREEVKRLKQGSSSNVAIPVADLKGPIKTKN